MMISVHFTNLVRAVDICNKSIQRIIKTELKISITQYLDRFLSMLISFQSIRSCDIEILFPLVTISYSDSHTIQQLRFNPSLPDTPASDLALRQIIIISVKENEDNFNQLPSKQLSPLIMFRRIIILNLIDILCEIQ